MKMGRRRADHGLSLVETLLALFILQFAVVFVLTLFESSLSHQAKSAMRAQGLRLARRTVADIRVWAADPNNFLSDWSAWSGYSYTEGSFTVTVEVDSNGRDLLSPSQLLEEPFVALNLEKRMPRSLIPVRVRADWGNGRLDLSAWIREPVRPVSSGIQISPATASPMNPDDTVVLSASLQDDGGSPIEGLVYNWTINPLDGNGTLMPGGHPRDRRSVTLSHSYVLRTGPGHVPGELNVVCWTYYHGRRIEGRWGPVVLLP